MIKRIALIVGTGVVTALSLTACNMNMTAPMIVRKMGDDTLWVKDIKDSTETVKEYKVTSDYYNSDESNPGQVFNAEYAVGVGETKYSYSW